MGHRSLSETVYSVEEEEPKQKSEEKNEEETEQVEEGGETKAGEDKAKEDIETGKTDEISETTDYDCTTDDESLKMIFSSTDQSNCCSGIVFILIQIMASPILCPLKLLCVLARSKCKLCPRNLFPALQLRLLPRPAPGGREGGEVQEPGGSRQQDQTDGEEEEAPPQPPERLPGLC